MSVAFAISDNDNDQQNARDAQAHAQEQARLTATVDDGVDADALQDYLLMKIQCAGARPTSRAQIHEAICELLQSPTPATAASSSSQQDLTAVPKPVGFAAARSSSSRSVLGLLNAVLAPHRLLKKRKRDAQNSPDDEPFDKRRKVLGPGVALESRPEAARRGLLFGLSRVATRRVTAGGDVFGPDASSPKHGASRSLSSWRLHRAELENERAAGRGVFSPTSGGASPLIGSLMSLVLSPLQPSHGSPARLSIAQRKTPRALAAFRFPRMRDLDVARWTPEARPQVALSHVRLPSMAFSPDGLRLSADSLFGLFAASTPELPMQSPPSPEEDTEMYPSDSASSVPFPMSDSSPPALPDFSFACSFAEQDEYPVSPSPSHSPVRARPSNPTPTAASEFSLYDDDEQPGLGFTFSTEAGSPLRLRRLSTASQDARYALPAWEQLRVRSASDARLEDASASPDPEGVFERNSAGKSQWVPAPRRWHALALRR